MTINWNQGLIREHTPLWSSLIALSMDNYASVFFPFNFSFKHFKKKGQRVYFSQDEIDEFSSLLKDEFSKDFYFIGGVVDNYIDAIEKLKKSCKNLQQKNFSNITTEDYRKSFDSFLPVIGMTVPLAYCLDFFIIKKLKCLLQEEFGKKAEDVLNTLSYSCKNPLSSKAHHDILRAATESNMNEQAKMLSKKYGWLNIRHFDGEPHSSEYYERLLQELSKNNAKEKLREYEFNQKKLHESAEKVISSIKNPITKYIAELIRKLIYVRTEKKDSLNLFGYSIKIMLQEVGKQLSISDPRYVTYWETLKCLENKSTFPEKVVIERKRGYDCLYNGKEFIIRKSEKYNDVKEYEHLTVLNGQTAYAGKVKGLCCVIKTKAELEKMQFGCVLITSYTSPQYVPAVSKSIALVTDEGGITSHAAIISREMKKPCVIGTKIATKVLKDGDLVEVDANKGVVRKL